MSRFTKSPLFALTLLFLVSCTRAPEVEVQDPYTFETRTYYESLDLSNPETAVGTFIEAYEAGDFYTVFLAMTSNATFRWSQNYSLFRYETLANVYYEEELKDDAFRNIREHNGKFIQFVSFMNAARDRDAMLFTFGSWFKILRTETSHSIDAYVFSEISPSDKVYVIAESIPGEVVFTVSQSPSLRWRIHQVAIEGGEPDAIPWSVLPIDVPISIPDTLGERQIAYFESLDLATPEKAIFQMTDAFQRGDFHTAYLILSPFAQGDWYRNLLEFKNEYLWDPKHNDAIQAEAFPKWDYFDAWYFFDRGMLSAKKRDALLIDLSGDISILEIGEIETIELSRFYEELHRVEVRAYAELVGSEVKFVMLQMPSGAWRVHQVVVPGGDEKIVPWSVPENGL